MKKQKGKILLLLLIIILLIAVGIGVFFLIKHQASNRAIEKKIEKKKEQIETAFAFLNSYLVEHLPKDYDKEKAKRTLQEFKEAIYDGKAKADATIIPYVKEMLADGKVTKEEADEFFKRIKACY